MFPHALMRGKPSSTTLTRFLWFNFPSHPRSQFPSLTFCGQDNITRGKVCRSHERNSLPNWPTPATSRPPPHLSHIPSKISIMHSLHHSASPHIAHRGNVSPSVGTETFFFVHTTRLVFPSFNLPPTPVQVNPPPSDALPICTHTVSEPYRVIADRKSVV